MQRLSMHHLFLAGLAALLLAVPAPLRASEDKYPSRAVSIICTFGAGTGADMLIRPVIPYLAKTLGTDVVTEYKSGAGGIVGANYFATKKPNGYTLLFYAQPHILIQEEFMPTACKMEDLVPLMGLTNRPDFAIVRTDDKRFATMQDVVDYARANPKKLTIGTTGMFSGNYLSLLLFRDATKLDFTAVPFESGGKLFAALLGRQIDMALSSPSWLEIYQGRLKGLASCTEERFLPDIPTMDECGIKGVTGTASSNFIFVKRDTPQPIIDFLKQRLNAIKDDPGMKKGINDAGFISDFAVYDADECMDIINSYSRIIQQVKPLYIKDMQE